MKWNNENLKIIQVPMWNFRIKPHLLMQQENVCDRHRHLTTIPVVGGV